MTQKIKDLSVFTDWKNYFKISILPKVICRFNVILIEIKITVELLWNQ